MLFYNTSLSGKFKQSFERGHDILNCHPTCRGILTTTVKKYILRLNDFWIIASRNSNSQWRTTETLGANINGSKARLSGDYIPYSSGMNKYADRITQTIY